MPPADASKRKVLVVSAIVALAIALVLALPLAWSLRRDLLIKQVSGDLPEVYNARWTNLPTREEAAYAYPKKALGLKLSSAPEAVLRCQIANNGALDHCEVVSETPPDYGFGQAALSLLDRIRLYPYDLDGSTLVGRKITVPITFPHDLIAR